MEKHADPFIGEAWPQWVSDFKHESLPFSHPMADLCARDVCGEHLGGPAREGRLQPGRQGVDGQKGIKFQPILEEHLKQPNLGGW